MKIAERYKSGFYVVILLIAGSVGLLAQETGLELSGTLIKELVKNNQVNPVKIALNSAILTLYKDSMKISNLSIDKKNGEFKATLPYGHLYKLTFNHPACVPMFLTIDTRIPLDKYDKTMKLSLPSIPFVDRKSVITDTVKYRFAFDRYSYNEKTKRIEQDQKYIDDFSNGKTQEYLDYRAFLREQKDNPAQVSSSPAKLFFLIGKIVSGDPPAIALKNIKIILTGDRGEPVTTSLTNNSGRFVFENVLMDQNYTIKINDDDLRNLTGHKITLFNKNDIEVSSSISNGSFTFHLLSSDKKTLDLLASEDCNFVISGNLLALINNMTEPIANTKIHLLDEKGNELEAMITNDFGTFVFTKTPAKQNFLIELAENNPKLANVKVIIADKEGKEINATTCNESGGFKFEFLKQDELKLQKMEVEETELRLDIKGKLFKNSSDKALANTKIDLIDGQDKLVQSATTDNTGNFKFSKVPYINKYSISTSSDGIQRVILADANGVQIKEYKAGALVNTIKFPLLPSDQIKLSTVSVLDPWTNVLTDKTDLIIPEKVYFEVNDYKITKEGQVILDKVVQVMKLEQMINVEVSSHTDSKGSADYNLALSQKRAKSAVDYMIAQGISKSRLTGLGYGETKLINKCADGVQCTEEEHAQNRRLEFKISHRL